MTCETDVYSREIINKVLVRQVSELVKNYNIRIWSYAVTVVNVKLCLMVPLFASSCSDPMHLTGCKNLRTN